VPSTKKDLVSVTTDFVSSDAKVKLHRNRYHLDAELTRVEIHYRTYPVLSEMALPGQKERKRTGEGKKERGREERKRISEK
jgi:hypothetical protein